MSRLASSTTGGFVRSSPSIRLSALRLLPAAGMAAGIGPSRRSLVPPSITFTRSSHRRCSCFQGTVAARKGDKAEEVVLEQLMAVSTPTGVMGLIEPCASRLRLEPWARGVPAGELWRIGEHTGEGTG